MRHKKDNYKYQVEEVLLYSGSSCPGTSHDPGVTIPAPVQVPSINYLCISYLFVFFSTRPRTPPKPLSGLPVRPLVRRVASSNPRVCYRSNARTYDHNRDTERYARSTESSMRSQDPHPRLPRGLGVGGTLGWFRAGRGGPNGHYTTPVDDLL